MYTRPLQAISWGLLAAAISYVANAQSIKTQINFPLPPVGIAANSFTNHIYVATPSYGGSNDTVTVIDGKTDTISNRITVPRGAQLPVIDILRDRIFVVGCDAYSETFTCLVTSINGITHRVIGSSTITTTPGNGILGAAYDPICDKLYIANASDNRIDIVDARSLKVVDSISTNGQAPFGISLNPFNQRLYVPYYTNQVDVFDVHNKALVATATIGTQDVFTAVNILTGDVYVTDNVFGPSTTGVLDQNGKKLTTVPVSETPYGLDLDPFTNTVYVASTGNPALTVINGATNSVSATLSGVNANFVSVNYVSRKVYLSGNNSVTVVAEK